MAVLTARAPRIITTDPSDDQQAMRGVGVRQFAEHQRAPRQSPELIGVGERNAAADAEVLGRELLKDVADDPHESAQEQPEQHVADFRGVKHRRLVPPSNASTSANTVPSSPTVKMVTNESGFMPLT